jgi:hypothetical protein
VVERRRIDIADPAIPGSVQPYHAAEGLAVARAEEYLGRCTSAARHLARGALGDVVHALGDRDHEVVACGLLLASGRPLPVLDSILHSHALIHTADGEHFRGALIHAAESCGLPVLAVKERELFERGAEVLGIPGVRLRWLAREMGRPLGPPWRQDEKLASLVAWLALAQTPAPKPQRSPRLLR